MQGSGCGRQDDCIFLPTKQRISHELRELRENNEETTYFAKEATARNTRTRNSWLIRFEFDAIALPALCRQ
jgi:hypothetical protein